MTDPTDSINRYTLDGDGSDAPAVGDEFRSSRPSARWPPGFREWPLEDKISHVTMSMTRKGLIVELLSRSGLDPSEYDLRDDSKLSKKELAAIHLALEGQHHARR